MEEKKTSAAQLRAAQKYKKEKRKRITLEFSPVDYDLFDHIQNQPNKQGYIKALIRADMEASRHGRWETHEKDGAIHYRCPFCKTIYAYTKDGHIAPCKCRKCGAGMERGGENAAD